MVSMCIIASHVIKHACKICDQNLSNKKDEKSRNYLKWNNSVKLFLEKCSSFQGHFCLTKGHLANLKGQVEIKSTSSEVIFDTIDLK